MSHLFLGPLSFDDLKTVKQHPIKPIDRGLFVNSGSVAIRLLLRSANLKPDSKVAIPALICPDVVHAIGSELLKPLFIDIDPETLFMKFDADFFYKKSPKIILLPHLYGMIHPQTQEIMDFSEETRIPLIHDAAQSFSLMYRGKSIATYNQGGLFSFGAGKATTAAGGAIVHGVSEKLVQQYRLNSLRWLDPFSYFFMKERMGLTGSLLSKKLHSHSFRASQIQLKAALVVMERFTKIEKRRKKNWDRLHEIIGDELYGDTPKRCSYYKFIINKKINVTQDLSSIPMRKVVKYPADPSLPNYEGWHGNLYELSTERSLEEYREMFR